MNYETIKAEIRARISEDVEDYWKDTQLLRMVNEAVRRFSHEDKWPWLYTSYTKPSALLAGENNIELIDDIVPNRHFVLILTKPGDTTGRLHLPRRVTPGQGVRMRAHYQTNRGIPEFYYVERSITNTYGTGDPKGIASNVRLAPLADTTYDAEFQYLREPAAIDSDDDEIEVPDAYVEAIIAWATGMLWLKELSGGGKAQEQFNIYDSVLQQAKRDMNQVAVGEVISWGRSGDPLPDEPRLVPRLPTNIGV